MGHSGQEVSPAQQAQLGFTAQVVLPGLLFFFSCNEVSPGRDIKICKMDEVNDGLKNS